MTQSLIIKDGAGSTQSLAVESSSYGYIPVHQISSSLANPVYVTGTVTVNTASTITVIDAAVTTATVLPITSFSWTGSASGTFSLAANSTTRKGLLVSNPGPHQLYICLSSAGGATYGFSLLNTASVPTSYSLILYPSGTYVADATTVGVYHGGYFVSGSSSSGVYATAVS